MTALHTRPGRVEVHGVHKSYAGVEVLHGIDLAIYPGEFVAIVGASGSGKSTLMNILGCLDRPTSGSYRFLGEDVSRLGRDELARLRREAFGFVFQSYNLLSRTTALENVQTPLLYQGVKRAERERRATEALEALGMGKRLRHQPSELSGGQQQRVALARALIVEPETLLLDEPLSNLDANLREEMRFEVRRLHDAYRYTTVYVTHDQSAAMTTADLIAVMNAGRIEQLGTPEEIYDRPRSEFVARFIGSSNILRGRNLDGEHVDIAGVALRCEGARLTPGEETSISIRQHDIELRTAPAQTAENVVPAKVVRQVYLGGTRDYMVELPDGTQLRVVTVATQSVAPGTAVWLHLPAARCRALVG